ncbi:MAG: ion channel [Ornithinibacter sp.]
MKFRRSWVVPAVVASLVVVVAAGGAMASLETGTVGSFPRGLWWALSLMTTVGFLGPAPTTTAGALLSVALMLTGFLLLALVSAALASMFVQAESDEFETEERTTDQEVLERLADIQERLAALERGVRPARDDS